jgi:isocitrate/isopropylmalate dehydrogenase
VHVCLVSGDGCGRIFCSEVVRVLNYVTSFRQAQLPMPQKGKRFFLAIFSFYV